MYIAIDGGGTKTEYLLLDKHFQVRLNAGAGQPLNLSQLQLHLPDIPKHRNRRRCRYLLRSHTCQRPQKLRLPDMRPGKYHS